MTDKRGHDWEDVSVRTEMLGMLRESQCRRCDVRVHWWSGRRSTAVVTGDWPRTERRVTTCDEELARTVLAS